MSDSGNSTNSSSSPTTSNDDALVVVEGITLPGDDVKNRTLLDGSVRAEGKTGEIQGKDSAQDSGNSSSQDSPKSENSELDEIIARYREDKQDLKRIKEMQSHFDEFAKLKSGFQGQGRQNTTSPPSMNIQDKMEVDGRSVYVGNVDYKATNKVLEDHFQECGDIKRITIVSNKFTGRPKGCAYIEFACKESIDAALGLDGSLFLGRLIKVMIKRTNQPGLNRTERTSRGTFAVFRGRGRGGGGYPGGYGRGTQNSVSSRRDPPAISISGGVMRTCTRSFLRYSPYSSNK